MPKPAVFKQVAPDRLELREGGGCLALFGVPFLAAGIFVILIGAGVVPIQNARDIAFWLWPLIVVFGLVFAGVGGALVFGRGRTVVDLSRGRLVKQWTVLVPVRRQEYSLQNYDAVIVRFEAGDSGNPDAYPVGLRPRAGGADLKVHSFPKYGDSRAGAVMLARFLRLPLVDAVTTHESVLAADHLDETLQDRLHHGDDRPDIVARPLRMHTQVVESASEVRVVIPGSRFNVGTVLGFVVPVTVLVFVAPNLIRFFVRTRTPDFVQFFFLGFLALVCVVLPLLHGLNAVRRTVRGQTLVTVTPDTIVVDVRDAWRTRETRIAAADVLDIDYGTAEAAVDAARPTVKMVGQGRAVPRWLAALTRFARSKGITLKTKERLVNFGAGLPDEELRYLYAVIKRVLGGTSGSRW